MKKRLSRRDFLCMAGGVAAGTVLAACQPVETTKVVKETVVVEGEEVEVTKVVQETVVVEKEIEKQVEVTVAPEPVTLQVLWDNWGDFFNDLMKPIGDSYTEMNPHITVEWTFSPDWNQSLVTALAAGDAPDVTFMRIWACAQLAYDAALLPLDAYFVQTGLQREDFILAMYDPCVWEGKLYALPGGSDWNALYYNKDLLEEVGIDAPPTTVYELVEQSLRILQVDGTGAIQRLGYSPTSAHFREHWGYVFGGEWYDERERKITADHSGIIECLNWLKAYADELDVDQLVAFDGSLPEFWSPGNSFQSNKTAFRVDGFWTYEALDEFAPDNNYGVAFLPTLEGKPEERENYACAGWLVGIPSIAERADLSWDFLNYGWVEYAWKMGCDTLNGPSVIAQLPQFEECMVAAIGADNRISPDFHVFTETGAAATKFWPAIPVNSLYADEVDRAYDFVIRGEKTPEEAMQEVTATVQKELDKIF
jgi:multiple sugar transport system substrate-binding protein